MSGIKVLVSDKLSKGGLAVLEQNPQIQVDFRPGLSESELAAAIGDYDALIIRSESKVTAKVIAQANRLRVIGRAGIGVDNVDVEAASKRGIVVMNTPTGNAVTTAEHAISLLLALARKIPQATSSMRQGKWEKSKFQGREVTGKTLGVLGLGNIGRIVAERAQGLKMNVIAFDPMVSDERAQALGVKRVTLKELFQTSDFITIHAPLTTETRNLIGTTAFDQMKPGVFLINAARGGIVDEVALAKAVEEGRIAGAALDVFEKEPIDPNHPLLKVEQVICTPHLGASTTEAQERVALEIAEQAVAFLLEGTIRNAVNAPTLPSELAQKLQPYITLGKALGRLLGQLGFQDIKELRVTCSGAASEPTSRPVTHAALAGFLESFSEEPVSAISAPYQAKERGIKFVEVNTEASSGFTSSVMIEFVGANSRHQAVGTLNAAGGCRLLALDEYELDAVLEGTILIMHNADQPGVIGAVGTILGNEGVNVSRMQVGLQSQGREAASLWNVDSRPSDASIEKLRQLPHVRSVVCVTL